MSKTMSTNTKWYTKKRVLLPVTALTALTLGAGIGAGSPPEPEIKTVEKTKVEKVEVPVEVVKEVTPKACLKALDSAEKVIDSAVVIANIAAQYVDMIPRAAQAGADYDGAEIEALTGEIAELGDKTAAETEKVTSNKYAEQASACRAEGA